MKSLTQIFQSNKKQVSEYQELLASMPVEEALTAAGAQQKMGIFHKIIESGKVDFKAFEQKECLLTMVANGGVDAAIWIADQSRALGIGLDRQDTYDWRVDPSWHEEHLQLDGYLDYKDRLKWQVGPYLKNTALLLSVKKGWNHVRETDEYGDPLSKWRTRNRTRMGLLTASLLNNGADPDIQDGCGNTALHIAVMHRDLRPIRALQEAGARNDLRNNVGLLPIDMLDINYDDINPFLYQQTGNDVNCYIFTLQSRKDWLRSGAKVREELANWPTMAKTQHTRKSSHPAPESL